MPAGRGRYLGDLSGGQLLKKAAIRGMKLPADGSGGSSQAPLPVLKGLSATLACLSRAVDSHL